MEKIANLSEFEEDEHFHFYTLECTNSVIQKFHESSAFIAGGVPSCASVWVRIKLGLFLFFQPKYQDGFEGNPERGRLGISIKRHFDNLGPVTCHSPEVDLQKVAFGPINNLW